MSNHTCYTLKEPLHIFSALQKYVGQTKARLHMPGHKGKIPILQDSIFDCTELSYTDCLECPTDCILHAEEDIAKIFNAKKSFLLTDGATCGIFVLVHTVKMLGGKLAIARNSHKSVYNACAVLGVEPVILDVVQKDGIWQQPTMQSIKNICNTDDNIAALLLTSPDYYGNTIDLHTVATFCKKQNILLFVDSAHGAFLQFDIAFHTKYAGLYADAWVDSLHKTTPCLTQGAILHTNTAAIIANLLNGVDIFRTTSPSYLIMASIEYASKYMAQHGAKKIEQVRHYLSWAKMQCTYLGLTTYTSDTLVLAIDFLTAGYTNLNSIQQYLEENGIFAELNDGRYLLFYCSCETEKEELERLVNVLQKAIQTGIFQQENEKTLLERGNMQLANFEKPKRVESYVYACQQPVEYLPIPRAVGRVAGRNFGKTPPCFPIVLAGEKITANIANYMQSVQHTFGLHNGKIPVLKNSK